MKTTHTILSLLLITLAISPLTAADGPPIPQTATVRGTILRINQSGIFVQKTLPSPLITSSSARIGAGGPIYDPDATKLRNTPGLPDTIFLTAHPWQASYAERDQIAAHIQYTGVTTYVDQYDQRRTIHTYRVTTPLDPKLKVPDPRKPAPPTNPLNQKPRR